MGKQFGSVDKKNLEMLTKAVKDLKVSDDKVFELPNKKNLFRNGKIPSEYELNKLNEFFELIRKLRPKVIQKGEAALVEHSKHCPGCQSLKRASSKKLLKRH